MDKNELKVGDVISFHDWCVGGFLFGVIIEYEDELYHSKLNIWRPRGIYFLQANGIDGIEVIQSIKDVEEYRLHDFKNFIKATQDERIIVNISFY